MERTFEAFLKKKLVSEASLACLLSEDIISYEVFKSLKEEHFKKLLQKQDDPHLTIGQHVLLQDVWVALCSETANLKIQTTLKSSAPAASTADPTTKAELFAQFKERMIQRKCSTTAGKETNKCKRQKVVVGITFGGMIYDVQLERGVKKQFLPPPRIVDFQRKCSYDAIINKGKELFFNNLDGQYFLGGSSGYLLEVGDTESWDLESYMKSHGLVPSKLRLYVVRKQDHSDETDDDEGEAEQDWSQESPNSSSSSKKTVPELAMCLHCGRDFLAPIPNTDCHLPDGGIVCYRDPVLECPICDDNHFGSSWNMDFMPDLKDMLKRD